MLDERSVSQEPELDSPELTEALIRQRAYQLYEQRGCEGGHDFDDWVQAESEISGKKSRETSTVLRKKARSATAA